MAKIPIEIAKEVARKYTEITVPHLISYVEERIEKYLPDIDEIELKEIEISRARAKTFVEDYRNLKSVSEAVWEMILEEKDKSIREGLTKLWDVLVKTAEDALETAGSEHVKAEVLTRYGQMMHVKITDFLWIFIPLIVYIICEKKRA